MLKKIKSFFERKDKFSKLLGFEIINIKAGYAKVSVEIKDQYLNAADVIHGGLLFSLADYAFALASNSGNNLSLAINANIIFHKAISGGTIYAKAKEIKNGKKIASYEVKIYENEDKTIATFTGTAYRKDLRLV